MATAKKTARIEVKMPETTPKNKPAARPIAQKVPQESQAYLLRIELCHLDPVIYREVRVESKISLSKLHLVIQAAMGWENCHMYGFALNANKSKSKSGYWAAEAHERFEPPGENLFESDAGQSDRSTCVGDVLKKPKDSLFYMYDFGDDWEHLITLQAVGSVDEPLPILVKAEYACPPEDCGGMDGFINMLQAFEDTKHPEHEDMRDWLGEDFKPGVINLAALQKDVKRLQPKKRKAAES